MKTKNPLLSDQKLVDDLVGLVRETISMSERITQLETENKRLREVLKPVAECFNCPGCRDAAREALKDD